MSSYRCDCARPRKEIAGMLRIFRMFTRAHAFGIPATVLRTTECGWQVQPIVAIKGVSGPKAPGRTNVLHSASKLEHSGPPVMALGAFILRGI